MEGIEMGVETAEVCMYGTSAIGAGWLAMCGGRMFGTGEPVKGMSFTEALWIARDEIRATGYRGDIVVFAPGGERCAVMPPNGDPSFGELRWGPAPVLVLSMADLLAASEKPS